MGNNPSHFKDKPYLPVETVSWGMYKLLSRQLRARARASISRLPTEAEGEHAARAGSTTDDSVGCESSKRGEYAG